MKLIVTAVNGVPMYRAYLIVMLETIHSNSPDSRVIATAYNWPDSEVRALNKAYGSVAKVIPAARLDMDGAAASHVRGELLDMVLGTHVDTVTHVAWMDPDVIIRRPLDDMFSDVKSNTLRIQHRPWQDKRERKFQDGVYVLGNGQAVRDMMHRFRRKLESHHEWYADQLQLYLCWRKARPDVRLMELGREWNDNRMGVGSAVWHAHMKHKWSSNKFNAAWQELYQLACEYTGLHPWEVDLAENRVKGGA